MSPPIASASCASITCVQTCVWAYMCTDMCMDLHVYRHVQACAPRGRKLPPTPGPNILSGCCSQPTQHFSHYCLMLECRKALVGLVLQRHAAQHFSYYCRAPFLVITSIVLFVYMVSNGMYGLGTGNGQRQTGQTSPRRFFPFAGGMCADVRHVLVITVSITFLSLLSLWLSYCSKAVDILVITAGLGTVKMHKALISLITALTSLIKVS